MALNWESMIERNKKSTNSWEDMINKRKNSQNTYVPQYSIVTNTNNKPDSYYDGPYAGMTDDEILAIQTKKLEQYEAEEQARRQAVAEQREARNKALKEAEEAREAQRQAAELAQKQQAQNLANQIKQQGVNTNNPQDILANIQKTNKEETAVNLSKNYNTPLNYNNELKEEGKKIEAGKEYYIDNSALAWEKPGQVKEKYLLNDISNIGENFFTGMFGGTGTAIEYINKVYNKVTGKTEDWANYEKISNDISNTQYSNINNNTNPITKKISELAPSIGQSTLALMYTAITGNPKVGSTVFGLSAAGGYYEQAKQMGLNEEQSLLFGGILGIAEGQAEALINKNRLAGFKAFQTDDMKKVLNSFGVAITENALQEAVMEPLQELTTSLVGGKANWKGIWKRAITAGIDGALMEILMAGAGAGLGTSTAVLNKMQKGKDVSSTEIQKAVQETEKAGIVKTTNIIKDAFKAATEMISQKESGTEMIPIIQWEGNAPVGGQVMQGTKINVGNKINADVAIVQTGTGYMAVDAKTGTVLDSERATQQEAIDGVTNKIKSLDKQSIQQIKDRLWLAETKIQAEVSKYQAEENATKAINASRQNQVGQIQDLTSKTTNYMSQSENRLEIENNAKSKGIVEIKDNIYNNIAKRKQDGVLNEHLKNNVRGKDYFVDGEKIIANSITIGKLRYGKTNFDSRIDKEIRNELKANIISNLDTVISNSTLYQGNLKDTKNHSFADTFDRRKSIVKYKGNNYEVMFEVGKKDGRNVLYSIETIKKTQKNRLSSPNLVSKRDLNDANKSIGSTKSNKSIAKKSNIVKSNERRNQNGEERLTHNGQETSRNNKGENSERKGIDEKDNGSTQKELSQGLRNYEEERKRKLGQDFKAEIIKDTEQSSNEKIVSKGFKEATGLDINIYKTNKNITEAAFYSNNGIFVKHNPLSSKKAANFKPFHEFGHWLKNNKNTSWQRIYNIVERTITQKQIDDYKKVINDQTIFETMSEAEIKEFVINEIISDYVGNWANNVENWLPYIEQQKISQEYAEFLADIALENKEYGYNVFGTLEQQEQVLSEITNIMKEAISKRYSTNVKSEIANPKQEEIKSSDTNIQDFGEKIGGARKDIAMRTGKKTNREVIHDYTVTENESGYVVNFKNKEIKDGFKTQEEAEKYILDFKETVKSNQAFVEEGTNRAGETIYTIKIRDQRTLKTGYTTKNFKNKQEAENYALALSMYLKEHNKNLLRPTIQKIERINKNSKNATEATGNDILNNFGFRGGEFGNWVNQKERQQFLNYALDAFRDLAEALEVEPSSLGQKGTMGIAFGARGKGLSGAVAHFEPEKKVINMTRLKGAGSLAHEYGHSIDNFISRDSGYDSSGMVTQNVWRSPRLSDRMKKAVQEVTDALNYSISTDITEVEKKNSIFEKNRLNSLQYHLGHIDRVFRGEVTDYKYNRKTKQREKVPIEVTPEQKKRYQKIRKILEDGKLEPKRNIKDFTYTSTQYEYAKPLEDLRNLYKEVVGRKLSDDTVYSIYSYGKPAKQITQVKSESAYKKSAVELDRLTGRASAYYSTEVEMWARAFESYIFDKLQKKGITNTYLVHSVNNSDYALFNPFPAGEERQNINKAFDNLIEVMKEEKMFLSNNQDTMVNKMDRRDVDITTKKEYNKYSSKLTAKEKAQIISEVRRWRINEKDGLHYIDLSANGYNSYIYRKQGYSIKPIKKVEGSQEYLNFIRKGIENGAYKTIDKWLAIVKNQTKNNRSDNVSLPNRGSNTDDAELFNKADRRQERNNGRNVIRANNKDKLENSKKSSFILHQNVKDIKNKGEVLKKSIENENVRYSDRYDTDENDEYGFYSQLEKAIEEKMPTTANSQQIKGILNSSGIKQDEMKWIGLDDYLKTHSLEKITKQQILDYIKANQIKIETVIKGDSNIEKVTEPIKEDIANKREEIKDILDKYSIDYEDDDAIPYRRDGTRMGTIGDFMPESLEKLVDLGGLEREADGSYINEYMDRDGVTKRIYSFTENDLKTDMQQLADLYDELSQAEMELASIEDEYGDYGDEIGRPKYKQYVIEGGTNYQEKLYTLPEISNTSEYKSPHWKEKNVLAHVRTQDFTDVEGNKVLFIEEIQSDMHQAGRKKGYISNEGIEKQQQLKGKIDELAREEYKIMEEQQSLQRKMDKLRHDSAYDKAWLDIENKTDEEIKNMLDSKTKQRVEAFSLSPRGVYIRTKAQKIWMENPEYAKLQKKYDRLNEQYSNVAKERIATQSEHDKLAKINKFGISDKFPFKKNWHEFALRRVINDAVSQGYDKVAWTTGKQQSNRYNLSEQIDSLYYQKGNELQEGQTLIQAFKDERKVLEKWVENEELEDFVGKTIAEKILNSNKSYGTLSGIDLEVGGEGMKGFYNKIIPEYLNKYLKKWNSQVETITLENADGKATSNQMGFKITEEMRNSIKQNGQPLYSDRSDLEDNSTEENEESKKQRKERQEIAKMIKERKFFQNVYKSDAPAEFKAELMKNRKQYEYVPISNKDTLEKAMATIRNTNNIKDVFLENELKTAEDTAIGEVLIQQAMGSGDYKEANSLAASLAEKLTNAGQIIQAAAMFRRMTPEGMLLFAEKKINQINKELEKKFKLNKLLTKKNAPKIEMTEEKTQFINNLMKEMQELEEKKKTTTNGTVIDAIEREEDVIIAKIVAKIGEDIPTTMTDKLASWRNISLLLNTKTIMRNLVSNTMFSSIENLVDVVGVPLDKAISLATGERSLLLPNIKTQAKGFKKGLDYAIYDTKAGISTSLGGNKYEIKANKNFNNKVLKALETASYFGVEGLDRPFMQAKYESALEMLMKLEGLKYGRDIATEEIKQQALEIAKYTTFKDKNAISDILSKVKRTLNANKAIGAADILGLTYTNVPGNLTKKAIDYSPVGLYNVIKKANEMKLKRIEGESTRQAQRELVQATSRFLIGTGIMAVSVQAFLAGVLTASGEEEDDKVKALTNQENYAINISAFLRWITGGKTDKKNGDLYVTYSNYEPLSSMIAAATEMTGAAKEGDNPSTIVYKGLTSWINSIAELSTISNFSSLFEYGDLGGSLTRSLSQFPASFIPTTAKQIAQLFETNSKANYSDNFVERYLINPIKQRMPGVISTLESYYDTMGNEEESYNGSKGLARVYDVFLNTSYTATVDMDATEQELYDLYLATGSTDHLPLQVKNYFTYKGEKINLTSKEKAEYQKQLGQKTAKAFKEKMTTREYKNMTDTEKVDALKSIINEINQEVKSDVVLEPRGLAYDARFSAGESLSSNGYKLILTEAMKKEYEQIASKKYQQYEKTGLYSEEKLKELKAKSKEYAKQQLMQKYKSKVIKSK